MMKTALLIVSLVCFVELYSVDAQTEGQCADELIANIHTGMTKCDAINVYAKCLIRAKNYLYTLLTTDETIAEFQTGFDIAMAKEGMYCSTNIKRIVEELREEDRNGVTRTTMPPKGYKDATTFGQCLDALMREAKSGKSCSLVTPYLKCALRVLNVDKLTSLSDEDYQHLNQQFKNQMASTGLYCDIDIQPIFEDIGREESGGNGSDVICRPFQLITLLMFTVMTMFVLR